MKILIYDYFYEVSYALGFPLAIITSLREMAFTRIVRTISILLAICFFAGCQDDYTNYKVDSAVLQKYLQSYLSEARERGVILDPKTTGLILSFGDCEGSAAGTTFYENPIRIVIDKSYWDNCSNYADGDYLHEEVIFHELTHALLYRGHDNSILPDGEWKSIMRGGTLPKGRINNISFRGMRRNYYVDELFHASTPPPTWSLPSPVSAPPDISLLPTINDDFLSGLYNPLHYYIRPYYSQSQASVYDQALVYENAESSTNFYFHLLDIGISTEQDFYFTTQFTLKNVRSDHGTVGLTFGDIDDGSLLSIRMSQDRQFHIYDNRERFASVYLPCESAPFSGEVTSLGIRRTRDRIDYYINSQCIFTDSITHPIGNKGNFFALILPARADTHIQNVQLLTQKKGELRRVSSPKVHDLYPVHHHAQKRDTTD